MTARAKRDEIGEALGFEALVGLVMDLDFVGVGVAAALAGVAVALERESAQELPVAGAEVACVFLPPGTLASGLERARAGEAKIPGRHLARLRDLARIEGRAQRGAADLALPLVLHVLAEAPAADLDPWVRAIGGASQCPILCGSSIPINLYLARTTKCATSLPSRGGDDG